MVLTGSRQARSVWVWGEGRLTEVLNNLPCWYHKQSSNSVLQIIGIHVPTLATSGYFLIQLPTTFLSVISEQMERSDH